MTCNITFIYIYSCVIMGQSDSPLHYHSCTTSNSGNLFIIPLYKLFPYLFYLLFLATNCQSLFLQGVDFLNSTYKCSITGVSFQFISLSIVSSSLMPIFARNGFLFREYTTHTQKDHSGSSFKIHLKHKFILKFMHGKGL